MKGNRVTLGFTALAIVVALLVVASAGVASPLERPLQQAGAPTLVSYQGQVKVGGVPHNGTGYFKFAVWSGSGGNEWTNDGTASGGGEPTNSVSLTVEDGLFNVLLGDTSLTNMTALSASVFNDPERYLRIWFSSDNGTFTLLSPDQRIAAVPYALQAEKTKGYANVVVVAKSGGDYTTISDALDSITTASDSNRYLVKVMPGVYNERVVMKEYVDIEGSGELNTRITYIGSSAPSISTLQGASEAELRLLTVESTGGDYPTAIYNDSPTRLTQLTISASGGTYNYGIFNENSSSPVMINVSASASGGSISVGVFNIISSPVMINVSASASGGTTNYGVRNHSSSPLMNNVSASASGGTNSYGVHNNYSSVTIRNSVISASEGTNNYGIFNNANGGSYKVLLDSSQITASTSTIRNDNEFTTRIGASLLSGGGVDGTVTCAGVYDEDYAFYASTCP